MSNRVAASSLLGLLLCAGGPSASGQAKDVVQYVELDALGTIRVVTDDKGNVIERHDYLPFGEECTTGPCASNPGVGAGQPRKFTGKERDAETGLDYFGARYYGSRVGRFTTVDPIYSWNDNLLDPQRWNRYAYGRNNPFRYVDPDGREVVDIVGGAITAFGSNLAWGANRPEPYNRDSRIGQAIGDAASVVAGGYEFTLGAPIAGLGLATSEAGVGVPVAAVGGAISVHGVGVSLSGLIHLSQNSGESGSYTITFESGKRYHGKGGEDRARASGKRVGAENEDTAKQTDWKPAKNTKEGFKAEARRIRADAGVENADNYNKINSPGEKLLKKE